MGTNRQRFLDYFAASRTLLGCVMRRNTYYCFTLLDCFILEIGNKLTPSSIVDGFIESSLDRSSIGKKRSVFSLNRFGSAGHARDVQLFMADCVSRFQYTICGFVQKVIALASNFTVTFLKRPKKLVIFYRPFRGFDKPSLKSFQFSLRQPEIPWSGHMEPIGSIQKVIQTKVYSYRGLQALFRLDVKHKLNGETGKPFAPLFSNGHGLYGCTLWYFTMVHYFKCTNLRHFNSTAGPDGILWVSDAVPLATFFEFWKTWGFTLFHTPEKVLVSFIKSFQNILQYLRMNTFIPRAFFFKIRQIILLNITRNQFTQIFICLFSFSQRPVVKIATHGKLILDIGNLRLSWINSVFERFSHCLRSIFQYGLLHFGQIITSCFLGIHTCPQRLHTSFCSFIFIHISIVYVLVNINNNFIYHTVVIHPGNKLLGILTRRN